MATKQKVLRVLNATELKKLEAIDNEFHKAIMILLSNTGLRISELVSLNIADVCFDDLSIREVIKVMGKGKKERTVPLNQKSKEAIFVLIQHSKKQMKACFNSDSPLIVSQKRSRMTRQTVSAIVKQYREELKIETQLTPHVLRHQFATTLLKKNVNMKTVSTLLGHSSISTTIDIYTHTSSEDMKEAVDLL